MEVNVKTFKKFISAITTTALGLVTLSCVKANEEEAAATNRYLYVAAGACYSGAGNTTYTNLTSSNLVYRINTSTGAKDITIADYNASPAQVGDSPVGLADIDSENLYVLVENTTTAGARRIERVAKTSAATRSSFSNNISALSAQLRGMHKLTNGDLLVSKSTAIEKITSANVRVLNGANPYVSAPSAPCATSNTLITKTLTMNNEFIMFLHAATGQNRFGFVRPGGFAIAGDCTVQQAAPVATAFPVAAVYDSVNSKLIVAYAGNATTVNINSIYAYSITETSTTIAIGAANKIYDANLYPATYQFLLYGISGMTYDPIDSVIYVATAINTSTTVAGYSIEKLSYDPTKIGTANTEVLTRVGTTPFFAYGSETQCIADMMIAD